MTISPARFALYVALIAFIASPPLSSEAGGKSRPVGVIDPQPLPRSRPHAGGHRPGSAGARRRSDRGSGSRSSATNFPERARALAFEIKKGAPLLVGLQEVALWRIGRPDGPPALGGTPATHVVYDFLALLLGELGNGDQYQPVVVQQEADLEAPTALGFDIRLTMRDVILVRRVGDVHVDAKLSGNFVNNLTLPIAGGISTVTSTRGWTAVDVVAKRRSFRFVNTHLEAFSNFYRSAQAFELIAGPLATALPIVLVGDLNSAPDDPPFTEPGSPFNNTNPYDILTAPAPGGGGLADTWPALHGNDPGFTCCQDADLRNVQSKLVQRIDHVMITDGDAFRSHLLGDEPSDRTRSGLWPSDHAGVAADVAP